MTKNRSESPHETALPIRGIPPWLGPWDGGPTFQKSKSSTVEAPAFGHGAYGVKGEATGEELALVRVFGIALILLLIIVAMALSQFVICLFTCSGNPSFL
jgi:hypothetical protein